MESHPFNDRFFGKFDPVLDAKNRVTVPAAFREEGMDGLMAYFDDEDGVIWLLDREEMMRMGQAALNTAEISREDALRFREELYSSQPCPMDAQGRLVLPADYVARLGLTGGSQKVVMVGLGARIEVRSPDRHAVRASQAKAGFQRVKGKVIV
ncbi:MAG: division/cell wall cluster transcriptional repressor MraZ [Verrucomicrobiales bacterium]